MPFSNTLNPKLKAIWSDGMVELPDNPNGWAYKCPCCSAEDPYKDWYLWDDEEYISAHLTLVGHSSYNEITAQPCIFIGVPVVE